MLAIRIPKKEYFIESTSEFVTVDECILHLEHSLRSVAMWESLWEKPFFSDKPLSVVQTIDYIKCMTLDINVNPFVYKGITNDIVEKVEQYIKRPMTATWFNEPNENKPKSKKALTAEVIYWQMTVLNIPFECDQWHLNRLLTLIKVCSIKNAPPKKLSKQEARNRNRAINAANRKRFGSTG